MKLPIIEYAIQIGDHPIATVATEGEAAKAVSALNNLGLTFVGIVNHTAVKRVVDSDVSAVLDRLDTAELASAFDAQEVQREVEAKKAEEAAAKEPLGFAPLLPDTVP